MTIDVRVTLAADPVVLRHLLDLLKGQATMSGELALLTEKVAKAVTVMDAAIAGIGGLRDQLLAAGTDPVALAALADQLDAEANALAAAVAPTPVA